MTHEKAFKLSREQELAVDVSKNIAVSAGAGSGKTTVLTARFLNLLESGLNMYQIGSITFTEKAALEMKGRIRRAVNTRIASSNTMEKNKWMAHLDSLGRANISTIHSFCGNIVRENAAYLGLDFDFSIISEIDKYSVLNSAMRNAVNSLISRDKYKDAVEKITNCFGREYIYGRFVPELYRLRSDIKLKAIDMKDMYISMPDGTFEKLCIELLLEADNAYMEYKLSNDILDYDDLESMTLSVLNENRLRDRYRDRFKALLVDEFQDTNEIQKQIIYRIVTCDSGKLLPKKLFIVGDFKQSIYGFRGTDYTIFKDVAGDIGCDGNVSLNTCYRSKNEIIHEVNSIFSSLIEGYEDLKFPDTYELKEKRLNLITYQRPRQPSPSITAEVKKMLQGKASEFKCLDDAFSALKKSLNSPDIPENLEGIAVSKSIRFLSDRGLKLRDICILVRSRYVIPGIEEELKDRKIPYCVIGGQGFYEKDEVKEILNLYRVLVIGYSNEFSPSDNINFIKALRGPLFQIPDNLILKIKIERDECRLLNLYDASGYVIDGMDDSDDKTKLARAYNILKKLYGLKERLSAPEFFRAIIDICDVFPILLSLDGGVQKVRNIEKLLREVEKIDEENLFTHEEFISYIDMLYANDADNSEASLDTEDTDAVKIMTIHQAKGLEFKGVIIPKIQSDLLSMSKKDKPNAAFFNGKIVFSKDLESGAENQEYSQFNRKRLLREIDENIRLLYVAMTRAKEYIILSGEDDGKGSQEIATDDDKIKNLNSFLKMIKYALEVKNASKDFIGFYNVDELDDIEISDPCLPSISLNKDIIRTRFDQDCTVRPFKFVSATKYMDYAKCPKKFYLENILNVNGDLYTMMEIAGDISEDVTDISGVSLGTVVHSVLERLDELNLGGDEELISETLRGCGLDDNAGTVNTIKRYIDNYKILENSRRDFGNLIAKYNEYEYSLYVPEGGEASAIGFIDCLQVFEKDGKYTAVITDYKTNHIGNAERIEGLSKVYSSQLQLYGKAVKELLWVKGLNVDNIVLEIYFLDMPERVRIAYDEKEACSILRAMDDVFCRDYSESSAYDFPKGNNETCYCEYKAFCRQKNKIEL